MSGDLGCIRWSGYSLAEKQEWMRAGVGPAAAHPGSAVLRSLASALGESQCRLRSLVADLGPSWSGADASVARSSLHAVIGWVGELRDGVGLTRDGLDRYTESFSKVEALIPRTGETVESWRPGSGRGDLAAAIGLPGDLRTAPINRARADQLANAALAEHEKTTRIALGALSELPEEPVSLKKPSTDQDHRDPPPSMGMIPPLVGPTLDGGGRRPGPPRATPARSTPDRYPAAMAAIDAPFTPAVPSSVPDRRGVPAENPPTDREPFGHRPRSSPGLAAFERPRRRDSDAGVRRAAVPDQPGHRRSEPSPARSVSEPGPLPTGPVADSTAGRPQKEDYETPDYDEEVYEAEFDRELGLELDEPPVRAKAEP